MHKKGAQRIVAQKTYLSAFSWKSDSFIGEVGLNSGIELV
jgi:hypothetical protein